MRASGNSDPYVCASNLMRTVRGEVPFDRLRGIDGSLIDRPQNNPEAIEDIEWLIGEYEPRLSAGEISDEASIAGDLVIAVDAWEDREWEK